MIAGWKVRRELQRFGQQLRSLPEAIWEPAAQRRHDAAFAQFPRHQGAKPLESKVALFLIWQPTRLAPSVLATCRHLSAQGYAVLIVSNHVLPKDALSDLRAETWTILERPNFGYDFGGYRDGLRLLQTLGVQPDRLVILNDSVWYPVYQADGLLAQAERSDADIAGTILRQRGDERFLESYFYSIQGHVLRSAAFTDFWNTYRLTSNKYKVIRRGERGFSRAMLAAGFQLDGLFREPDFLSALSSADPELVRSTLAHAAFVDPALSSAATALAAQGSHQQCVDFMRSTLAKHQFYSTYPVAARRLLNYPVLKKSMEPVSLLWRTQWLRAVEQGLITSPIGSVVDEARSITPFRPDPQGSQQ